MSDVTPEWVAKMEKVLTPEELAFLRVAARDPQKTIEEIARECGMTPEEGYAAADVIATAAQARMAEVDRENGLL